MLRPAVNPEPIPTKRSRYNPAIFEIDELAKPMMNKYFWFLTEEELLTSGYYIGSMNHPIEVTSLHDKIRRLEQPLES